MSNEDISPIRIGQALAGIIGLKEAIAGLAPSLSRAGNAETAETLMTFLAKKITSRRRPGKVRPGPGPGIQAQLQPGSGGTCSPGTNHPGSGPGLRQLSNLT